MRIKTLEQKKKEAEYARNRYSTDAEYRAKKKAKMKIWASMRQQTLTPKQRENQREYQKKHDKTPRRMQQKREAQQRYRNKMRLLGLYKKYRGNRAVQSRRWKNRPGNKVKSSAHNKVYAAIKNGSLKKQLCEKCGQKAVAHHDDYNQPLDVRWLCNLHHYQHHNGITS